MNIELHCHWLYCEEEYLTKFTLATVAQAIDDLGSSVYPDSVTVKFYDAANFVQSKDYYPGYTCKDNNGFWDEKTKIIVVHMDNQDDIDYQHIHETLRHELYHWYQWCNFLPYNEEDPKAFQEALPPEDYM